MSEINRYTDHDGHAKGILDPSSDEEQAILLSTLSSFYLYRRAAHYTFTHRRRRNFYTLPRTHQKVLQALSYQDHLNDIDTCIESNATLCEAILKSGCDSFGVPLSSLSSWSQSADSGDMDKARSTIKQFLRDWSTEGATEREKCYSPIIEAVDRYFGAASPRCEVRVLVPGAGLGRLAFEICRRGYATEGNEFSYHQLIASNWVLNATTAANTHTLHPFTLSFSHNRSRENQLRAISIPDVHPGTALTTPIPSFLPPNHPHNNTSKPKEISYRPSDYFSMSAGEFVECYNTPEAKGTFNCVATAFFIDTARNLMVYLETIRNVLEEGGVWINNGPLLWHWEGADASAAAKGKDGDESGEEKGKKGEVMSHDMVVEKGEGAETLELPPQPPSKSESGGHSHSHTDFPHDHSHSHDHGTHSDSHDHSHDAPSANPLSNWKGSLEFSLEEVLELTRMYGFEIVEQKTFETGYIEDDRCMARYVYTPEYWVAVKKGDAEVSEVVRESLGMTVETEEVPKEGDK